MASKNKNVIAEAYNWKEMGEVLAQYGQILAKNNDKIVRFFGYASMIKSHKFVKLDSEILNERAILRGSEAAMNVFAAGEFEYRSTYNDELGIKNTGLYAGLEDALSEDGYVDGLNVTVEKEKFHDAFYEFARREFGTPPENIDFDAILNGAKVNLPEDGFGLYKMQIVKTQNQQGEDVIALTTATNEKSALNAIGLTPVQAAQHILDGQGYVRHYDDGKPYGGTAMTYFYEKALGYYRDDEGNVVYKNQRIEDIKEAVENMAHVYDAAQIAFETKQNDLGATLSELNEQIVGANSVLFDKAQLMQRPRVDDKTIKSTKLPRTAEEKFQRIQKIVRSNFKDY